MASQPDQQLQIWKCHQRESLLAIYPFDTSILVSNVLKQLHITVSISMYEMHKTCVVSSSFQQISLLALEQNKVLCLEHYARQRGGKALMGWKCFRNNSPSQGITKGAGPDRYRPHRKYSRKGSGLPLSPNLPCHPEKPCSLCHTLELTADGDKSL